MAKTSRSTFEANVSGCLGVVQQQLLMFHREEIQRLSSENAELRKSLGIEEVCEQPPTSTRSGPLLNARALGHEQVHDAFCSNGSANTRPRQRQGSPDAFGSGSTRDAFGSGNSMRRSSEPAAPPCGTLSPRDPLSPRRGSSRADEAVWQSDSPSRAATAKTLEGMAEADSNASGRLTNVKSQGSMLSDADFQSIAPREFLPHTVWCSDSKGGEQKHLLRSVTSPLGMSRSGRALLQEVHRSGDIIRGNSWIQRLIRKPSDKRKITWDIMSMVFLAYDAVLIPMAAFTMPTSSFMQMMSWVTTIYWTLDMPLTFIVGYHDGGLVEMRPGKIASHYVKSWFLADIIIAILDWSYLIDIGMESTFGLLRVGKSARITRMLRIFRLIRVMKVFSLLEIFGDYMQSEGLVTVLHIGKLVVGIAMINHFIACVWYAIANLNEEADYTWLKVLQPMQDKSLAYAYTSSLHWSLTQFTPASMEVVPRNAAERTFSICIIILALVMFSSFLSSITQHMTRLRELNKDWNRQQECTRKFIADKRISLDLGNRIYSFLRKHQTVSKRHIKEGDVPIFAEMPETLLVELHSEVYMPTLMMHPFFHLYVQTQNDEDSIVHLCHFCMKERSARVGQELFHFGDDCKYVYFVVNGHMNYVVGKGHATPEQVHAGQYVSEMGLWMPWIHCGILSATTPSELVTLDAQSFYKSMSALSQVSANACRTYAALFVEWLGEDYNDTGLLSDIWNNHDTSLARRVFDLQGGETQHSLTNTTPQKGYQGWSLGL